MQIYQPCQVTGTLNPNFLPFQNLYLAWLEWEWVCTWQWNTIEVQVCMCGKAPSTDTQFTVWISLLPDELGLGGCLIGFGVSHINLVSQHGGLSGDITQILSAILLICQQCLHFPKFTLIPWSKKNLKPIVYFELVTIELSKESVLGSPYDSGWICFV